MFRSLLLLGLLSSAASAAPSPLSIRVFGHGKPIILLPGLSCGGAVWDATVAHLAPTHEVHLVGLPGFAGLPGIEGEFVRTVRASLAEYIRAHHLLKPVIIGHSIGAFLAYDLAIHEPDLLGGVLGVDGVPFFASLLDPSATASSAEMNARKMREALRGMSREQFVASNARTLSFQITSPLEARRVGAESSKSDQRTVGQAMYEMFSTDLRAQMAAIKIPVWVLGAANNQPYAEVELAYREQLVNLPSARLILHPTARHFVMLDEPRYFFDQVDAFLKGAPK